MRTVLAFPCFILSFYAIVMLCVLLLWGLFIVSVQEQVFVETRLGRIEGWSDGSVQSFLGIPYAEPPLGTLRFQPPQPKRSWYPITHVAREFAPECLQSELFAAADALRQRDENCLYVNIWSPASKPSEHQHANELRPVMIWIYGGAFIHGGSSKPEYHGQKLAEKGIVVVTFNYRVGALGFLVSLSEGLFGNYGLADQKLLFQWVQENIQAFGGDPERVTLFGESAGAMSIGLHVLDQRHHPGHRPLFHHVIMQSNPWGYKYRSVTVANFIGTAFKEQLDCDDLRCLQSESGEELVHVQDSLMAVPRSIGDFFTWGPVLTDTQYEREARGRSGSFANISVYPPLPSFLSTFFPATIPPAYPNTHSLPPLPAAMPLILGYNKEEGVVFIFAAYPRIMGKGVFLTLLFSLFRGSAWGVLKTYQGRIRQLEKIHKDKHKQANRSPPTSSFPSPRFDYRYVLAEIFGDYLFACPARLLASHMGTKGVRLYEFALPTRTPGFPPCEGLSCHTCELPYPFAHLDLIQKDYSMQSKGGHGIPADEKVSYAMSTYWTRLAYSDVNTPIPWEQHATSSGDAMCSVAWQWGDDVAKGKEADGQVHTWLPFWPEATGDSGGMPYLHNIQGIKVEKEKRRRNRNKRQGHTRKHGMERDFFDDDDIEEFWGVGTGIPNSNEDVDLHTSTPPAPASSTLLKMVFGSDVFVAEEDVDSDCICAFWNSLGYRF